MDTVVLNRIELFGSVGVAPEEKSGKQRYWITIELNADLRRAGKTDELEGTIDYAAVFRVCEQLMQSEDCDLLEAFADKLVSQLLTRFPLAERVSLEILKPDAPIEGTFDSVGIRIARSRSG